MNWGNWNSRSRAGHDRWGLSGYQEIHWLISYGGRNWKSKERKSQISTPSLHIPRATVSLFSLMLVSECQAGMEGVCLVKGQHRASIYLLSSYSTLDSEVHCSLVFSGIARHSALVTRSVIHRGGNDDKWPRGKEPRGESEQEVLYVSFYEFCSWYYGKELREAEGKSSSFTLNEHHLSDTTFAHQNVTLCGTGSKLHIKGKQLPGRTAWTLNLTFSEYRHPHQTFSPSKWSILTGTI